MYKYDKYDQTIVDARVDEFRDQVARRLAGAISEDQFKPLRLKNGLYLQLHAYMLRVAIPYGTLNGGQMRVLGHIARKYDRGYGHFTTRQNIQYNWIKLEDAPDILAELAKVEMHAIQTSGESIRNVSSDQYAGAAADEIADPRPWAELIRQATTFHPEFSYLPRKFKIALTAADEDRAAIRLHDIGLKLVKNDAGELGFEVYIGGGMGRTPFVAPLIRPFLPVDNLFSYCEAALRVWNRWARRDNIHKQRIKILVHDLGAEEFTRQVEAEWQEILGNNSDVPRAEFDRIAAYFTPPPFETGLSDEIDRSDPDFALWLDQNVVAHKAPGYAIANISLKPIGGIPGDATSEQMRILAEASERFGFGELRISHEQNVILPHVKQDDLFDLWKTLDAAGLATANAGLVSDIISCPGLDYCALATARSIPIAQAISKRFSDLSRQRRIGKLGIKISGCINACGHHHVGAIGILGLEKKGQESYQITLGGDPTFSAAIGEIVGPGVTADQVPDVIEHIVDFYLAERQEGESFIDTWRRVGHARFKDVLRREGEDGADI